MRIRLTQRVGIAGTTYPIGTEFDVVTLGEDVVNSLRVHNAFDVVPDPPPPPPEDPPAEVASESDEPKKPGKSV